MKPLIFQASGKNFSGIMKFKILSLVRTKTTGNLKETIMKNTIGLLLLMLCLISCNSEEKGIKECFETYKSNILISNGDKAVKCLNQTTLYYYSSILSKVRHAKKNTVYNLNIIDRLMVLKTRNQIPKDKINSFTTKSYISYAITNGMIGNKSVERLEFLKVKEIKDNEAKVRVKLSGTNIIIVFKFSKERSIWNEDGIWKINLKPLMAIGYKAMKSQIASSGISEDQYVMGILQATNDGYVDLDIWKPTMEKK